MKLFKLYSIVDPGYDCNHGFVVRARDEQAARKMAQQNVADEKSVAKDFWLNSEYSVCEQLSVKGVEEIILFDYLQG